AVLQYRRPAVGIHAEKFRRARLAFGDVHEFELERNNDVRGDGLHLAGVGRGRKSVEFHGRLRECEFTTGNTASADKLLEPCKAARPAARGPGAHRLVEELLVPERELGATVR